MRTLVKFIALIIIINAVINTTKDFIHFEDGNLSEEPITGTTYYVATTGSNKNEGTSSSEPLSSISAAIEKMEPGDGVIISEGTFTEKITISKSGISGKPIIIRAKGNVIIDGQDGGGTLLTIAKKSSYINIEGLTFKNLNAVEAKGICLKAGCNHIQISGCYFENIQTPEPSKKYNTANAVYFEGSGETEDTAIDNITIKSCTLKNIGAGWSEAISVDGNCSNIILDGITATAPDVKSNICICICGHDPRTNRNLNVNRPRHVTVTNCNIKDCVSPYGNDAYCIYVDGAYDVTITGNTVASSEGGIEIGAEHETTTFKGRDTEKVVVEKNTIDHCKTAIYIGGFNDKTCGYAYDVTVSENKFSSSGDILLDKCDQVTLSGVDSSKVNHTSRTGKYNID